MWSTSDLARFGRDGYLVAPGVVAPMLQAAACTRIRELLVARPVPAGHTGHHFYFLPSADEPVLVALLTDSGTLDLAAALTAPRRINPPAQVQVALTFPPHQHRPGGGHLDGFAPTEPDGRPGTFTLLAGVVLSDQTRPDSGNLIVWPGSHHATADLVRQQGADALIATGGHPDIPHDNPLRSLPLPATSSSARTCCRTTPARISPTRYGPRCTS